MFEYIIPTYTLKSGYELPVLGLGTWQMGGRMEHDTTNDDERDIQAIQNAIEQGITHIDTAELYADGYTETLLGKAIRAYDRNKLFLASKVKKENATYEWIHTAIQGSLTRLGTKYLDLYMIHARDAWLPLERMAKALDEIVDTGLVRSVWVSNFSKESLIELQSYMHHPIVTNQVHYNLVYRECEATGLLEYCQQEGIVLVAWRPVQYGTFAQTPESILVEMATKYQKTPAQIAMNWLTSQSGVATIFKTTSADHLKENLESLGWSLLPEDVERLRREYPNQQMVSDRVPLW